MKCGFERVPNWGSVYYHPVNKCSLMIYVDDFKMSGSKAGRDASWKLLKQHLTLDDPVPLTRCLGCDHETYTKVINDKQVRVRTYDMSRFSMQCVDLYCKVANCDKSALTKVATPSLIADLGSGHAPEREA